MCFGQRGTTKLFHFAPVPLCPCLPLKEWGQMVTPCLFLYISINIWIKLSVFYYWWLDFSQNYNLGTKKMHNVLWTTRNVAPVPFCPLSSSSLPATQKGRAKWITCFVFVLINKYMNKWIVFYYWWLAFNHIYNLGTKKGMTDKYSHSNCHIYVNIFALPSLTLYHLIGT